jgi:hypothetical protein
MELQPESTIMNWISNCFRSRKKKPKYEIMATLILVINYQNRKTTWKVSGLHQSGALTNTHGAETFLRCVRDVELVKKFLALYGNRRLITVLTKTSLPVSVLKQTNPVHTLLTSFKIHFNITLP